jgi:hypothetical protein
MTLYNRVQGSIEYHLQRMVADLIDEFYPDEAAKDLIASELNQFNLDEEFQNQWENP